MSAEDQEDDDDDDDDDVDVDEDQGQGGGVGVRVEERAVPVHGVYVTRISTGTAPRRNQTQGIAVLVQTALQRGVRGLDSGLFAASHAYLA
eukprot:2669305-Rhodomonas_salina.1